VLLEQVGNNRVVHVNVGWVLITGGYAVTGNDSTVHNLGWGDDGGQSFLCVYAVYIGIMQQTLGLKHLYICNSWQVWIFSSGLNDVVELVSFNFIWSNVSAQFAQEASDLEACDSQSVLMLVLFEAFYWLHFNNNVHGLGEWGVVCARTGHINDTFLEAYDLTGGNNSSTFENVGSAFANGVNFSNPSWENAAIAFYFYARLDDVFNRCDSYAFTWTSEENFAGCDIFIFQSDFADFFFVNVQNAVFYF